MILSSRGKKRNRIEGKGHGKSRYERTGGAGLLAPRNIQPTIQRLMEPNCEETLLAVTKVRFFDDRVVTWLVPLGPWTMGKKVSAILRNPGSLKLEWIRWLLMESIPSLLRDWHWHFSTWMPICYYFAFLCRNFAHWILRGSKRVVLFNGFLSSFLGLNLLLLFNDRQNWKLIELVLEIFCVICEI